MNEWERQRNRAEYLKKAYPPRPIQSGMRGTVKVVDDIGTVHCEFDSGRSLGLIDGEDDFRALTAQELAEEENTQGEDNSPVLTM